MTADHTARKDRSSFDAELRHTDIEKSTKTAEVKASLLPYPEKKMFQGLRKWLGISFHLPNSEIYTKHWDVGTYHCKRCQQELFSSDAKFHANTRWPSFRQAIEKAVATRLDLSHGMTRTEILCSKCHMHLGHVFDDGAYCGDLSAGKGLRYSVASQYLSFIAENEH